MSLATHLESVWPTAVAEGTPSPMLTREKFVLQALIDFDLVEESMVEELQARSAVQPTLRRRTMSGPQKLAMLASLDDLAAEHSHHEHEDPSHAIAKP